MLVIDQSGSGGVSGSSCLMQESSSAPATFVAKVLPSSLTPDAYGSNATVNTADIGIENTPSAEDANHNNGVSEANMSITNTKKRKSRLLSMSSDNSDPALPYLSKRTISYLCASESQGSGGDEGKTAADERLRSPATSSDHTMEGNFSSSSLVTSRALASPLSPVPLPDPLLKTLLLKGGPQSVAASNTVLTLDSSFTNEPKPKTPTIIAPAVTPGVSLADDKSGNIVGDGSGASNSASLASNLNSLAPGTIIASENATISATFAFGQAPLPAALSVPGKEGTKSLILMDVANKSQPTLFKLPSNLTKADGKTENESFMVIEASGIVPQSPAPVTVSVANQQPQQHNMEILLQAIDMKETSPSVNKQQVAAAVNQVLPVVGTANATMASPQPGLSLHLAPRPPHSPARPPLVHKLSTTMSPMSPLSPAISSPIFSTFAIQRAANPNSFSNAPTLISSSMLSPIPAGNISAGTLNLPVYSLSPSSPAPLLSTVTSPLISVPPSPTSSAALHPAVFLSPSPSLGSAPLLASPTVIASHSGAAPLMAPPMLALPTPSGLHTPTSAADLIQRRMSIVRKDVERAVKPTDNSLKPELNDGSLISSPGAMPRLMNRVSTGKPEDIAPVLGSVSSTSPAIIQSAAGTALSFAQLAPGAVTPQQQMLMPHIQQLNVKQKQYQPRTVQIHNKQAQTLLQQQQQHQKPVHLMPQHFVAVAQPPLSASPVSTVSQHIRDRPRKQQMQVAASSAVGPISLVKESSHMSATPLLIPSAAGDSMKSSSVSVSTVVSNSHATPPKPDSSDNSVSSDNT